MPDYNLSYVCENLFFFLLDVASYLFLYQLVYYFLWVNKIPQRIHPFYIDIPYIWPLVGNGIRYWIIFYHTIWDIVEEVYHSAYYSHDT